MTSILYPWVMELGLRHQGALMSAMRSCDTAPRHDPSKMLSRVMRASVLTPHSGRFPEERASYIVWVKDERQWWDEYTSPFLRSYDQYPNHFVVHILQAAEIIGYCAPLFECPFFGARWREFYDRMCLSLHVNPETPGQMHTRLNADGETFVRNQDEMRGVC
jgi:hypothetical protein